QLQRGDAQQAHGNQYQRDEHLDESHAGLRLARPQCVRSDHGHARLLVCRRPVAVILTVRRLLPVHALCLIVNVVSTAPVGGSPVAPKLTTGRLFVSTVTPAGVASKRCRISSPTSMTPAVPAISANTSQPLLQSFSVPLRHTSVVGPVRAHTAVGRPRLTASLRAALSATTSSLVSATTRLSRIICVNDGTPRPSRTPRTATATISSSTLKP